MRVLVTGGAGYIGSHAVRGLLRAGHEPVVVEVVEVVDTEPVVDFSLACVTLASVMPAVSTVGAPESPAAMAAKLLNSWVICDDDSVDPYGKVSALQVMSLSSF